MYSNSYINELGGERWRERVALRRRQEAQDVCEIWQYGGEKKRLKGPCGAHGAETNLQPSSRKWKTRVDGEGHSTVGSFICNSVRNQRHLTGLGGFFGRSAHPSTTQVLVTPPSPKCSSITLHSPVLPFFFFPSWHLH